MKTFYISDDSFINTSAYEEFMRSNPVKGRLRIRAYAASGALPVKGVKVIISTYVDDYKIIFFEGLTDESGVIPKIELPAPRLNSDNMLVPDKREYEVEALYSPDNIKSIYKINIYEDICVEQIINIVPELKVGGFNGR